MRRFRNGISADRLGVPSILAGIVTNMGLYTINLMVMGWSANVSLLRVDTIFSLFEDTGLGRPVA